MSQENWQNNLCSANYPSVTGYRRVSVPSITASPQGLKYKIETTAADKETISLA